MAGRSSQRMRHLVVLLLLLGEVWRWVVGPVVGCVGSLLLLVVLPLLLLVHRVRVLLLLVRHVPVLLLLLLLRCAPI